MRSGSGAREIVRTADQLTLKTAGIIDGITAGIVDTTTGVIGIRTDIATTGSTAERRLVIAASGSYGNTIGIGVGEFLVGRGSTTKTIRMNVSKGAAD